MINLKKLINMKLLAFVITVHFEYKWKRMHGEFVRIPVNTKAFQFMFEHDLTVWHGSTDCRVTLSSIIEADTLYNKLNAMPALTVEFEAYEETNEKTENEED